jgi:hypothetical protein
MGSHQTSSYSGAGDDDPNFDRKLDAVAAGANAFVRAHFNQNNERELSDNC